MVPRLCRVTSRLCRDLPPSDPLPAAHVSTHMQCPLRQVSGATLARNVYDVVTAIPPAPGKPEQAPGAEEPELASWCGAAEAGTALAAADAAEGARRRRKRQRREGLVVEGVDGGQGLAEGLKNPGVGLKYPGLGFPKDRRGVRWACGALQRRAWSAAWLALLRMPLPDDIFRKVCLGFRAWSCIHRSRERYWGNKCSQSL